MSFNTILTIHKEFQFSHLFWCQKQPCCRRQDWELEPVSEQYLTEYVPTHVLVFDSFNLPMISYHRRVLSCKYVLCDVIQYLTKLYFDTLNKNSNHDIVYSHQKSDLKSCFCKLMAILCALL